MAIEPLSRFRGNGLKLSVLNLGRAGSVHELDASRLLWAHMKRGAKKGVVPIGAGREPRFIPVDISCAADVAQVKKSPPYAKQADFLRLPAAVVHSNLCFAVLS
ncbi:hypothetical protein IP70_13480 [alpha proteobacterium AAP38]|nr:hypothetical protein IP70_13480 [alpha proteobacterium AAP38]